VANVNENGCSFSDDLVTVQKVWQVSGWVLLKEFWFHDFEPFISGFLSEKLLVVWDLEMLKQEPDSFSKSSDLPVTQSEFVSHFLIKKDISKKIISTIA
jgi:hypothetical protein